MELPAIRRVAELRRLFEIDRESAWVEVAGKAGDVVPRVVRKLCRDGEEVNDVVAETVIRVCRRDGADLHRASDNTPIDAWLQGVGRRIGLEMRRKRARSLGSSLESEPEAAPPTAGRDGVPGTADLLPVRPVPPRAYSLFAQGHTFAEISRELDISWHAARRRVGSELRSERRARGTRADRLWARRVAPASMENDRLLALYREGRSYAEIGDALGITRDAARGRIRRLRTQAKKQVERGHPQNTATQ